MNRHLPNLSPGVWGWVGMAALVVALHSMGKLLEALRLGSADPLVMRGVFVPDEYETPDKGDESDGETTE